MSDLRIGVVGAGARVGLVRHLAGAGGEVVALADPDQSGVERLAAQIGRTVPRFDSVAQLVTDGPHLDAAIVLTPDDTHEEVAVALLEAGVAVYLEKPIAITTEGADRILQVAHHTGAKLYVGHNMRHMPVIRQMKAIIDRGDIGEVKAVWCRHFVGDGGDYYFKDWHAERARTTSLLLQKGAHDLDVIHWLAGGVARDVVGIGDLALYGDITDRRDNSGRVMQDWYSLDNWPPSSQTELNPVVDVEDISMVMGRLDNGVLISYQQCHFAPDYWRNYTVIGTEGRLENAGDGGGGEIRVWNRRTAYSERGDVQYPIEGADGGHGGADPLTVAEFCDFVRTGSPTDTSPVAARDAVAAGVAGATSLRTGSQPQHISPVPPDLADYYAHHQQR
ncbi:Gfo/Idh/MocA family protein [Pseudactinotalea sp.]|uniref:Gfo/Idh/MocA family protein n=1 Tax=Pseudactinotalea sp. TaxID=1926260 RepID=UPI003B3A55B7